MVTESHAARHLTLLPLPLSARDVPQPTAAAMAWVIDESGQVAGVDRSGAEDPRVLPAGLRASEVSYGADDTLWVLAAADRGTESILVRFSPAGDSEIVIAPFPVRKIAAAPDGALWLITTSGEVVTMQPSGEVGRHSPPGEPFAEEVSVGPEGSVWVVSTTSRYAGRIVKRLTHPSGEWFDLPAPASATKLGVAPDGMAWTINSRGEVWRLHPLGGGSLAECQVDTACSECRFSATREVMTEIGVGPDGTVWVIGATGTGGQAALMWLADPHQRRFSTVPTRARPVRVAGGVLPATLASF